MKKRDIIAIIAIAHSKLDIIGLPYDYDDLAAVIFEALTDNGVILNSGEK